MTATSTPPIDPEVERRWSEWLVERNRTGARIALRLTFIIYPAFGLLDYLSAPREWLTLLLSTRAVVVAWSLVFYFALLDRPIFTRLWRWLTAAHTIVLGWGIGVMVVALGGFRSPYYAGFNLTMLGAGLLFVWPVRTAVATFGAVVAGYLVPNALLSRPDDWTAGVQNLFFVLSTGVIVSVADAFGHASARQQLVNRVVIERTKENLERAHEQLKQLDRFKSQFFANITHELKTPLAMILAPLELMLEGKNGKAADVQRATLHAMFRNGLKLLKLIGDLLDLSKLEESRLRLRVVEHDLAAYVRTFVAQVQPLAQRKGIEMTIEAPTEPALVHCDVDRVERVLVNLVSNATKFTPPKGTIAVRVVDEGDAVRIEVADTGPGFPSEMNERVFERFFQVDMGGTRRHGGTGIGLALAKELVELHGGEIWAESAVGEGATFRVRLPKDLAHFSPDVIDRRAGRRERPGGAREGDRGISDWTTDVAGRRDYRLLDIDEATEQRVVERDPDEHERAHTVLVVEDTPDVIRVVSLTLRQDFRILAAPDGAKGLELAHKHHPDLVITDLMMPEVDGLELTRRLRANASTRHIPIVMLTARGDLDDRVVGLESGVNAYLTKPFSAKELLTTVRSLVDVRRMTTEMVLHDKLDSLESIAGGLAHEINNPLNYIKTAVAMLHKYATDAIALAEATKSAPLDEAATRKLDQIAQRGTRMVETAEAGVRRIGATVDLLRRYAREGYTRTRQPYDLFAGARDVVAMVLPATGRDVRVELDFEGDGTVACVPEELNQVITNLVQNAIEAVREGSGHVWVRGRGEAGSVVLSVRDDGPGIDPENRAKVFTPFYTTKAPGAGMGMGLAITQQVVTSLGGTISVGGQLGVGAEFVVRLPRSASTEDRESALWPPADVRWSHPGDTPVPAPASSPESSRRG